MNLGTASADGNRTLNSTDYQNNTGTLTTTVNAFAYSAASNGRVTLTSGSTAPPVLYLYGPSQGVLLGTGPGVNFGIIEPQAAGPFSDASFAGAFRLGTESPVANFQTAALTFASGCRNV